MPTTEEELEESGTNVASLGTNIARKYMDQVRRRKVYPLSPLPSPVLTHDVGTCGGGESCGAR